MRNMFPICDTSICPNIFLVKVCDLAWANPDSLSCSMCFGEFVAKSGVSTQVLPQMLAGWTYHHSPGWIPFVFRSPVAWVVVQGSYYLSCIGYHQLLFHGMTEVSKVFSLKSLVFFGDWIPSCTEVRLNPQCNGSSLSSSRRSLPAGKKDALNLHVGPHIHIVIYIYRIYIYIYIKLYIYIHIYIYIWPVYIHIYIYLSLSLLNLGFEFTNVCVTPCSLVFVYPFGLVEWRSRALWISQYEYSPPSLWRCIWMKSLNQCAILPFVHTWEL